MFKGNNLTYIKAGLKSYIMIKNFCTKYSAELIVASYFIGLILLVSSCEGMWT